MKGAVVFQSDFGLCDGAVAAMHGVAYSQDPMLRIFDLTHDIPQFDIWEASYRLIQTVEFWPKGTVFVSVVDPGVGSQRQSVAAKTVSGQYIITPDNGTLTHIHRMLGIEEVRLIKESQSHNPIAELSYTFHGRDVYAYMGARLAAGKIAFEEIGEKLPLDLLQKLPLIEPYMEENGVAGTIDVLDVRYGSLWTSIPYEMFEKIGIPRGGRVEVFIQNDTRYVYQNFITYGKSFADVRIGESLVYVNSLKNMAVAINQGSFARAYDIGTGNNWRIAFHKAPRLIYE